jgi:hypothetical protein
MDPSTLAGVAGLVVLVWGSYRFGAWRRSRGQVSWRDLQRVEDSLSAKNALAEPGAGGERR